MIIVVIRERRFVAQMVGVFLKQSLQHRGVSICAQADQARALARQELSMYVGSRSNDADDYAVLSRVVRPQPPHCRA